MSLDERQLQLRRHLDKLGFNQPLPIGAIGLVSALVDDLIQTTETLKEAKQEIAQLLDEKAAWDLGAEPYKCDNSRLLSEVNSLHMQLLKQADTFELETAELRIRVRNLTYNNKVLEERNTELNNKVKELEFKFLEHDKKTGSHIHRRPFISTVRSSIRTPGILDLRAHNQPLSKCKCSCSLIKRNDVLCEIEKLQVEVKNQEDSLHAYKKQIEARDREIMRLNALFTGGRPADALARDCCYKNVNALTEDVQYLQEQKMLLEQKLAMINDSDGENFKKVHLLAERNAKLEKDLEDMEKVALSVESQANNMVLEKNKEIAKLKETINQTHSRLLNLERGLFKDGNNYEKSSVVNDSNEDTHCLVKQITDLTVSEKLLKKENEKLKLKYLKLKQKFLDSGDAPGKIWHELEKAREDKDFYQKEYSRILLESKNSTGLREKITNLTHEVNERNMLISDLKSQITELHSQLRPKSKESDVLSNTTLQATIHRLERERDVAIAAKNQIIIDQEALKEQLRLANEAQLLEKQNHEKYIENLNQQIKHLQSSERELLAHQRPSSATITILKGENHKLIDIIKQRESEITQLKVENSQIKILLEQTERAMAEQKNQLCHTEHRKEHIEQHIQKLEAENLKLNQDISELGSDVATLKTNNHTLMKEKDRLVIDLDMKTEKIYHLENNLESLKSTKRDLQDNLDRLQRKLSTINSETIEKETTLRSVSNETDHLRKQITTLKRTCDNALNENSRLTNELADTQVALNKAKENQVKAENDTENLKEQIKQYITEVERVNNILAAKEQELLDMIDNYKSMTQDTQMLEEAKQSLTYENNEARQLLKKAQLKITDLEEEIELRGAQIQDYQRQMSVMSTQISELENEIKNLRKVISIKEAELINANTKIDQLKNEKERLNENVGKTIDKPSLSRSETFVLKPSTSKNDHPVVVPEMNHDIIQLQEKVDKLEEKLEEEHDFAKKADALAKEYKVQVQELRRMITDERLSKQASSENVNPYPTL